MELDQRRVKRWLLHMGLLQKNLEWNHIHVSGHGSGDQIKGIVDGSRAKTLVPFTENMKNIISEGSSVK